MGLFGKKVKFDADSFNDMPALDPPVAPHVMAPPVAVPPPATTVPAVSYGIAQAIELMRALPNERTELVGRVVRQTLESMNIHVSDIVVDAERREAAIRDEIAIYRSDIVELEKEIAIRRSEITRLEVDLAETTTVKQRLRATDGAVTFKIAASS
jgi:hypothetical protein